jgi:hypothetical protein
VALGATALVPVRATLPIPWSMLTDLAPEVFQFSVEDSPVEILEGLASKELITGDSILAGAQPGMRKADDIRTRQSVAKTLFMF